MEIPKLVFKYKSVHTKDDLLFTLDILKKHRLYFPNRTVLNDPLEGKGIGISPGYAGCWRYAVYDDEDPVVDSLMNQYRILSLSEDGFSPQLWAHYGRVYSGICFGFRTSASFSSIRPVQYIAEQQGITIHCSETAQYDDHFLFKHIGWAYEKEWRIINKTDDSFFFYRPEDLACVIFGCKMEEEILEVIQKYLPKDIPVFKAFPGYHTFCVKMEPLGYKRRYEGLADGVIHNAKELLQYIDVMKVK